MRKTIVFALALCACGGPAPAPVQEAADKVLVLVDMQNDFIDGSLGSEAAQAIVPVVADKVRAWDGYIVATRDTHGPDYLTATLEGKLLPVEHCFKDTDGWQICPQVVSALEGKASLGAVDKVTFGSVDLPSVVSSVPGFSKATEIQVVGLDTDICVVSNALLIKALLPDVPVRVDGACCAGVTPEQHDTALAAMRPCQIDIL